jgi:hypothetical protein
VVTWRIRRVAHRMGEAGRFLSTTARGLDGAMIGYLASGFFVTVLFYPYLWFALGMTSALYAATLSEAARTAPPRPSPVPLPVPSGASPQSGAGWRTAASQRAAAPVLWHRRKPGR